MLHTRLQELLGRYILRHGMEDYVISFGQDNRLVISCTDSESAFVYRRFGPGDQLLSESLIMSDEEDVVVGIFPIPPFMTPKSIARNVYLKFRSPVVMDQKSEIVLYSKIPVEIGVYRQSKDEELLLDAFSMAHQQYALYGPPETGVVCRYKESEVSAKDTGIEAKKYEEATARIRIVNMVDNIVKVSKVIIPMEGVVLNHAHDDSWLPGTVEMHISAAFGKEVVNVRLVDATAKRADKTSVAARREETLTFFMDTGY